MCMRRKGEENETGYRSSSFGLICCIYFRTNPTGKDTKTRHFSIFLFKWLEILGSLALDVSQFRRKNSPNNNCGEVNE